MEVVKTEVEQKGDLFIAYAGYGAGLAIAGKKETSATY